MCAGRNERQISGEALGGIFTGGNIFTVPDGWGGGKGLKMNTENGNKNKKLNFALGRCIGAFVLAVVLLALTGFSVIDLINGPKETVNFLTEEQGSFVSREVPAILGFYAEDARGDHVTARYAVVPVGGKLVTVRFTERYLESAKAVCDNTYAVFNGEADSYDKYVVVQGTLDTVTNAQSAIMYDWFGLNREQLVELRVINDTDDYADYLDDTVLLVDTVNGHHQNLVIGLSIAAGVLLLYMLLELVLMGAGFYLPIVEKAKTEEGSEDGGDAEDSDSIDGESSDESPEADETQDAAGDGEEQAPEEAAAEDSSEETSAISEEEPKESAGSAEDPKKPDGTEDEDEA